MPRTPDQALRKFIAELAATDPEDLSAILAALDSNQRARTVALLAEFAGLPGSANIEAPGRTSAVRLDLSSWLTERLEPLNPASPSKTFHMTSIAWKALDAAAAKLSRAVPPERAA